MDKQPISLTPDPSDAPPLSFDVDKCNGCNRCLEACQVDVLVPNPQRGLPPIAAFPGECWYCGCCVMECPRPGAICLNGLPQNSVHFKRSTTNEDFYV